MLETLQGKWFDHLGNLTVTSLGEKESGCWSEGKDKNLMVEENYLWKGHNKLADAADMKLI